MSDRSITVNGVARTIRARLVAELIDELALPGGGKGIAIALNGEVVRRNEWDTTEMSAGDRIEIVGAVQGG